MLDYMELAPPPPLDRLVHCFWFLSGTPDASAPQPIVPDGRAELVLHLAEPFGLVDDAGRPRRQANALLAGQLTRPIAVTPLGTVDVMGIRFRTAAARSVLGLPLGEMTDRVHPLGDVAPKLAGALLLAAERSRHVVERVRHVAQALQHHVARAPTPLIWGAVLTLESRDWTGVGQLATGLGVTARTLERRFWDEIGVAPKTLHRVLRFRRAFRLLQQGSPRSMARVAAAAGYADQPHLIREFRRLAGTTPRRFFSGDPALASAFVSS